MCLCTRLRLHGIPASFRNCHFGFLGEYNDEQIAACFRLAAEVYDLSMCILQSFEFDNLVRAHEMLSKNHADMGRAAALQPLFRLRVRDVVPVAS